MSLIVKQFGIEQTTPSHRYGPHVRDHYLIHYVSRGKGVLTAEGQTHNIGAGQAFVIFPDQVTVYQADTADPWHYGWVGFIGEEATSLIRAAGAAPVAPVIRCRHNLLAVVRQMQQDVELADSRLALTGGLMRFLALLGDADSQHKSSAHALYEKVLWHFRSNYMRPITIAETARVVGLSRSQLFRVFRGETGQSPKQALTTLRLEEAYRLLLETTLSVQEISYAVGIASPSRLCTLFSAKYGLSPGRFIKQKAHRSDGPVRDTV